jgi:hypothetical protein
MERAIRRVRLSCPLLESIPKPRPHKLPEPTRVFGDRIVRQQSSITVAIAGIVLATGVVASGDAEAKGFRFRFGKPAQAATPNLAPASANAFAPKPQAAHPAAPAASAQPTRSGGVVFIPTGRERKEPQPGVQPVETAPSSRPPSVGAASFGLSGSPAGSGVMPGNGPLDERKGFAIVSGSPRGSFGEVTQRP